LEDRKTESQKKEHNNQMTPVAFPPEKEKEKTVMVIIPVEDRF